MGGQFIDDDGRWRSAHRLSTAVWVQWRTAGGLSTALAGMPAEVFAALMPETHVADCAESPGDAPFAGLQHGDRRWWGRTR
jgi:hypothetical protein